MSRTLLNLVVDCVLLALFVILLAVTAVVQFVFPQGSDSEDWVLWGGGLWHWRWGQFVIIAAFALTVLLHVMLHWSWVCGVVAGWMSKEEGKKLKSDDGLQTIYGVGLLIVLFHGIAAFIAAAALTIRGPQ